ncbi:MAG: CDP-glucose 4,6-dehydratase [Nitrospirae bacterium]|nr:CDP-glucose 4,6-dehydratase [Nitrospirota bacterium]
MTEHLFRGLYKGKTVLVTGHTGFKGSWLAIWLTSLGAKVIGYSLYLPSKPCNFTVSNIQKHITHIEGDIRNINRLKEVFLEYSPDIVFHLAAQPIVRRSFKEPALTFGTNVLGTVNVLECIRVTPSVKSAVIITSDKCYKNNEWLWGYRENDILGGDDPYSASKACAEIASHAYIKSFFNGRRAHISTARAGNVIGGGDWAGDRVIPDCVRAWSLGEEAIIRSPEATRPWQHVLEPLSGYLWLGVELYKSDRLHGEAFNFGPTTETDKPVRELVETFLTFWGKAKWKYIASAKTKESTLLKLSCDKALSLLEWHAVLPFKETVRLTAEWYKAYYSNNKDMFGFCLKQIKSYVLESKKQALSWTNPS